MQIFIPAIAEEGENLTFEVQSRLIGNGKGKLYITGNICQSLIDGVNLSIGLLRGYFPNLCSKILDTNDVYVHFTESFIFKEGYSATLAIFTSLAKTFLNLSGDNHKLLVTGDIDLNGKLIGISNINEKYGIFSKQGQSDMFTFNTFIHPKANKLQSLSDCDNNANPVMSFDHINDYLFYLRETYS